MSLRSGPDWLAVGITVLLMVGGPLVVRTLGRLRDRRRAAKARADAPDYGQLTPREHFAWRGIVSAYNSADADFQPADADEEFLP